MPALIGDCVMAIPLVNELTIHHKITIVCNDYTIKTFSFLFNNTKVVRLSSRSGNQEIIIDLLGNTKSINFIKQSNAKVLIGFPDTSYKYTHILPLPFTYSENQAPDIFLESLRYLNIQKPRFLNFNIAKIWSFKNQDLIFIAPGAGNLERCFSINSFIELANQLSLIYEVRFILGPSEQHLAKFINTEYEIIITNKIETTLNNISNARLLIVSEGGFMHIAAAYGIPLIGLFKIASPINWFPYSNPHQVAIGKGNNNYTNLLDYQDFPLNEILSRTKELYEDIKN